MLNLVNIESGLIKIMEKDRKKVKIKDKVKKNNILPSHSTLVST